MYNTPLSGVAAYSEIKEFFDVPEGVTGFKIRITATEPAILIFEKVDWANPIIKKIKGATIGEVDLDLHVRLANILGITDVNEVSEIVVEVKSYDDIVTTTVKKYTGAADLHNCLKLIKENTK